MSKKAWIIFAVACIAVLTALVLVSRGNQIDVSNINEAKIIAASEQNGNIADHVSGSTEQKTILIEYGDFQCPACASAFPNISEVKEEFKEDLTFIFRNLPLTSIHPNARAAAAAAEAAGLQGVYWEMHDELYENQNAWSGAATDKRLSFFETYAKAAGVKDIAKFKTDMNSKSVNDKINFDLALAKKVGASATPAIYLDGKKIEADVWSDKAAFKKQVEEAIKK